MKRKNVFYHRDCCVLKNWWLVFMIKLCSRQLLAFRGENWEGGSHIQFRKWFCRQKIRTDNRLKSKPCENLTQTENIGSGTWDPCYVGLSGPRSVRSKSGKVGYRCMIKAHWNGFNICSACMRLTLLRTTR